MAHQDGENDIEERPSERRHRSKSEKDPNRPHKSSRSSRPKVIDPETGETIKSPHKRRKDRDREKERDKELEQPKKMAEIVPELSRTASAPGTTSRSNQPYPSFNKACSKEAVTSRDDIRLSPKPNFNPYTPESTDVDSERKAHARSKSAENVTPPRMSQIPTNGRPPSPPETEFSQQSQQRQATPTRKAKVQEDSEAGLRPRSRTSWFGRDKDGKSKVSVKSKGSEASTIKSPNEDQIRDSGIGSAVESNITPKQDAGNKIGRRPSALGTDSSPASAQDSSPRTPTQTPGFPPSSIPDLKPTPAPFIRVEGQEAVSSAHNSPQPPPPPPPPNVPFDIPRVDYLMQNGGLPRPVQKTLLAAAPTFASQSGSSIPVRIPSDIEKIFGPYYQLLDQYDTVINKNGSLAVATGYKSVARRLLDRLENVFNRDLSSEGCFCVMCQHPDLSRYEGTRGLGWGEVLEWVSGRRELPVWPAFDFAALGVKTGDELAGLGISGGEPLRPGSPIKIDPDIAEEYRESFLQQSKKTKQAVNKWLSSCPETTATPPQEVDDETLSFAILTHLEQRDRPVFNALVLGSTVLQQVVRSPTTTKKPRSELMVKTVHSLQRLYRLPVAPRDPEAAIYLLKNPELHNLLATMSSISTSEWEVLISGRFDGFLWSGADFEAHSADPSPAPSRGPTPSGGIPYRGPMSPAMRQPSGSRTNTPFSPGRNQTFSPPLGSTGYSSRGPTPSQLRQPVSNDEETEMAILAEVEREIYLSMEALEDAFEGLHRKAEDVRRRFRERGAALSMSLQSRRTSHPDIITASTPGLSSAGLGPGYERPNWADGSEMNSESEWDPGEELMSELAPDDSASNISSSRHRRPKRRNERRTPALVEEEDED